MGEPMLRYIPLHLSVSERSQDFVDFFIERVWNNELGTLVHLTPEGWFDDAHNPGNFMWTPPPAAADVVAEQLGEARHKRPFCFHIVIVPRLMTGRWRRSLLRETDFSTTIPIGTELWGTDMHEPLTLFVCFPLYSVPPWTIRGTPFLEKLDGKLRSLWKTEEERCWSLLRELFKRAGEISSMSEGVVRRMLYSPSW